MWIKLTKYGALKNKTVLMPTTDITFIEEHDEGSAIWLRDGTHFVVEESILDIDKELNNES